MTRLVAAEEGVRANPHRFRLHRAGVLNVWQYDRQVFDLADGRLLLRGANGAGKSKTLEMLLPFVLDGDKARLTASGRHHTSLLWLMLENGAYDGTGRIGYLWVEFQRTDEARGSETLTCGVGIRASQSARTAAAWFFTVPGPVPDLEDDAGPLGRDRCREAVLAAGGAFFEGARQYREHVGRLLFGLEPGRYDELLRLLYWLRQPQVGEDIEPGRLAEILSVALPELDDTAVRSVGDTLDQLAEFGEQLDRRERAARAVADFGTIYRRYATGVVRDRAQALIGAHREQAALNREAERCTRELATLESEVAAADARRVAADARAEQAQAKLRELERDPAVDSQRVLQEKERRARELAAVADRDEVAAAAAAEQARAALQRVRDDAGQLTAEVANVGRTAEALAAEFARYAVRNVLAVPLLPGDLDDDAAAERLQATLAEHGQHVAAARTPVGEVLAAVRVVREALEEAERADGVKQVAERRLAEAEEQLEGVSRRLEEARAFAAAAEREFLAAVAAWAADPRAVPLSVDPELTAESLAALPPRVRAEAAPTLAEIRAAEAAAAARERRAEDELGDLRAERSRIEGERDPAPAPPPLPRTSRHAATGAPLWLLTDFAAGVDAEQRAAVEAALEASGLLDAWVRSDGAVLDAADRDTVLPLGPAVPGRSLAGVLVPSVPHHGPVSAGTVAGVLRRIALADDAVVATVPAAYPPAVVGLDGSWHLGVLVGRAEKPTAQYIGATARAAERARRLAAIDQQIVEADAALSAAAYDREAAAARAEEIERWLADLPASQPVLRAWVTLDERTAEHGRAATTTVEHREKAQQARRLAAEARQRLGELAARHQLPQTRDGLAARRDALREIDARLDRQVAEVNRLVPALQRWVRDHAAAQQQDATSQEGSRRAAEARRLAEEAQAEYDTLLDTLGADVRALEQARRETQHELATAKREREDADTELARLRDSRGQARQAESEARRRLNDHVPALSDSATRLAATADAEGLLAAALDRELTEDDTVALAAASGLGAGDTVPKAVLDLARRLAALPVERAVDEAGVYAGWQALATGPAAETEPRVLDAGGALVVFGRDDAGEYPVAVLARRLSAQVTADRELLTVRERKLFEEHLLGDLGDCLRRCRTEAAELVAAMNALLGGVRTSQGIRVRLDWSLRDDVPPDVRDAVELLGKPLGALLPDERTRLRDALHRLIEASRAEDPELSYTEHLGRALDYRRWSEFRVRINRPESPDTWQVLGRRTPLSQGEQKVVCYLPLFAAAAAHFTSVAGAAPHAPRFILLDDAFPKIDVSTHPRLFGLLVDLDLDFVVTSERLWGDYPTVPSLAIYEALRSPTQRGIAQYRHVWDGQRLRAVGA